jgi:hypothetical protein
MPDTQASAHLRESEREKSTGSDKSIVFSNGTEQERTCRILQASVLSTIAAPVASLPFHLCYILLA